MLFTKVRGTRKVTRDVIHPRTVLRRPKALYLSHNSEPKSFRERISFFLFRFTALMKYLFTEFRARKPSCAKAMITEAYM